MVEPDPLAAELEDAAVAAFLAGDDAASTAAWEQAHSRFGTAGQPADAARCAFWSGLAHLLRGEQGQAAGWLARAGRCAEEAGPDCPTAGLLLVPAFLGKLGAGDAAGAHGIAEAILAIGRRTGDGDVLGFGQLSSGEALVALGRLSDGVRCLDEAMVAVTAGELSPIASGIIYCAVIEVFVDVLDLRRAAEWTEALDRWCAARPGLVPFRGQCLVHRSQVLQASGAWVDAMAEASRACEHLIATAHPAVGNALYQLGEVHRVRGELVEAEAAYREASRHGHDPEPGLALVRLAAGDVAAAVAAVDRALDGTRGRREHLAALVAAAEVFVVAGRVEDALQAATELQARADADAPLPVAAHASFARARVALADGDAAVARDGFRAASDAWLALGVPYEAARCREQLGIARFQLGDTDGADLDLDVALAAYEELGAVLDAERVRSARTRPRATVGGLSDREVEVLRIVATGATNRDVAETLSISEHTVARHLQNIYVKLGLSSRAAATAYAHTNGLV